jgi:hypothetical protein
MRLFRKSTLFTLLLSGLLVGGTVSSKAGQESDCTKDIRKSEQKLAKEIDKHGMFSREAEKARRNLEKSRTKCWIAQTHKKR